MKDVKQSESVLLKVRLCRLDVWECEERWSGDSLQIIRPFTLEKHEELDGKKKERKKRNRH